MPNTFDANKYVKIPCLIRGSLVLDTDRERIRQKITAFLTEEKNYHISDFIADLEIHIEVNGIKIISTVDIAVNIEGKTRMIIRGGPGSVVTREAGTIAAARLLYPEYIVPWAVQANLFDSSLLNVRTKKKVAYGWENIPSRLELLKMTEKWPPPPLPEERIPIERQILYSYDTHG